MTDHEKVQELGRIKDQAPIATDSEKSALIVVDVQRFLPGPNIRSRKFSRRCCRV